MLRRNKEMISYQKMILPRCATRIVPLDIKPIPMNDSLLRSTITVAFIKRACVRYNFQPGNSINFNYKIVKSIIKVNRRYFVLRNKIIYVLLRVYYLILRIFNDPTVQRLLEPTMISLDRSLVQGQTISIIKVSNIDGVVTFT